MSLPHPDPGIKPDAHPRTHIVPAEDDPGVLPFDRRPLALTWLARLHRARLAGDFRGATLARGELNRLGWSIGPYSRGGA